MSRSADTIYALSSGSLPAGVAVVRVSGSRVDALLVDLFGTVPAPRQALLKSIHDRNGQVIDNGLVVYFQAPRSFTGEDCVEFQLHGGRAVVAAMAKRLADFGLRQAGAGEFSRRAFENGKLDLVEIEGLADLVSAETEMQRRLAMEQSSGRLSGLYQGWMTQLTRCRALIEAELDFPDEDDIPGAVSNQVWEKVALISSEIEAHLQGHRVAEIIRDGFKVVIAGRPNAGKSSLMNALARRDVAIVTDVAGTTRDLIAVDLDLGGYLVRLTDTAGLRESDDRVEIEGIRRTHLSLEQADLILHLRDIRDDVPYETIEAGAPILHVATKLDMIEEAEIGGSAGELQISVATGDGIDSLVKRILSEVESRIYHGSQLSVARQRQSDLLEEVQLILRNCIEGKRLNLELRSEYLRRAAHTLGKITGFVDTEDLLDVIFSEFCIGK